MSELAKYQDQKQELDYFRNLAFIANKGGTHNLSPEALMNIMLTAKDLGISPMKAINGGFYVVNGKISMSTALMADRIRKEGHSIKIPEWNREKCVIIGVRKDNNDSVKFEFTMEDAQAAGLLNSPTWKKFPKQMLYNRAMSTLARTLFPDVVGNAYSEDEKWDIMDVPPEKRPEEDPDQIKISSNSVHFLETDDVRKTNISFESLKQALEKDDVDTSNLEICLSVICSKKQESRDKVIESALLPQLYPRFKEYYLKINKEHVLPSLQIVVDKTEEEVIQFDE